LNFIAAFSSVMGRMGTFSSGPLSYLIIVIAYTP